MGNLTSETLLIIDLASGEISEEMIEDEFYKEHVGGAAANLALYKKYQDEDPIVLGTGLLAGTLVPGSSLSVITAKSPRTGKVCHAPVNLYGGIELKYTGFDFVVIKGVSEKPVYLWLHDQVADVSEADEYWGLDVWETTDKMRVGLGEDLIQVLAIGKAGENASPLAQVNLNYWATGDQWGFGGLFGQKKIKAIAMRGMGMFDMDDEDAFLKNALGVLNEFKNSPLASKKGIAEIGAEIGEDIAGWLEPLTHRHSACFNTPVAFNTFLKFDDDPKILKETDVEEPGILLTNIYDILGFKNLGMSVEDAARVLQACMKYGIDPVAVAELSQKAGKKSLDEIKGSFSELSGDVAATGKGTLSPCTPLKPLFHDAGSEGQASDWWEKRQAVAYICGIQHFFILMAPFLSDEKLLEFINQGTGLEITADVLNKAVAAVISG